MSVNDMTPYGHVHPCKKDLARYDEKDEDKGKDTDLYKLFNTNTYGEDCETEKE